MEQISWLRILPVAVVTAHLTACLSGLAIDWLIVHIVALVLVVAAALARLLQGGGQRLPVAWLLVALLWLLWLAINGPSHPPSPDLRCARVAVDAAMFTGAAVVLAGSYERGLVALGQGVTAALLLAIGASLIMRYQDLGLGMMNHLLVFTVPIGAAWAVWQWPQVSWRRRGLLLAVLVVVVCWSLFGASDGPRRGGLLAIFAGCLAPLAYVWSRRHPRWAAVCACATIVAVLGLGLWASGQEIGREYRTQRIGIWSASWEGVSAWWPWGGGAWSSLRLSDLPADAARVVSSGNAAFDHPHNELLAVLQDQGLIGLLLMLGLAAMLVVPVLRMERSRVQDACLSLLASTLVFLMVENAYSLPACRLMLGLSLGLIGAAVLESRGSRFLVPPRLTTAVLVAGVIAAAWAAWRELPAALLPRQAPVADLTRPMAMTNIPQVADLLMTLAYRPEVLDLEPIDSLSVLALRRFGNAPGLVRWRFRAVCAATAKALAPVPGRAQTIFGSRVLVDECCHVAERVLHADPFLIQPYQIIAHFDRLGMAEQVDPVLRRRARMLTDPQLYWAGSCTTLAEQADGWAFLTCRQSRGWSVDDHRLFVGLLESAGGSAGIADLAASMVAADPVGSALWSSRYASVLRYGSARKGIEAAAGSWSR